MRILKFVAMVIAVLMVGALGALVFNASVLPYLLASTQFDNIPLVRELKNREIVVNPTEQIYIQENTALQNAIIRVQKSVVTFQGAAGVRQGVIVTSDGFIITLANTVKLNGKVMLTVDGQMVSATVTKLDIVRNLALLQVDRQNLPTVAFANPLQLQLGQRVFLTAATVLSQGNWLANEGIIREVGISSIKTTMTDQRIVQGSPLFTIAGELVGINVIDQEGRISAVSVKVIKEFLGL